MQTQSEKDAIRESGEQAAERERLRDTFAAAALTGLLSNVQRYQNGPLTKQAFEIADFMLRERSRTGQGAGDTTPQSRSGTNHDAAPAARAYADGEPAPKQRSTREGVTLKTLFSPQSLDFSGEYEQIPPRMRDAILRYACHGAELGSFLQAVIRNDLFGAFGSADAENKPLIGLYVSWFYNRCPECLVGAENYRKQTSILG